MKHLVCDQKSIISYFYRIVTEGYCLSPPPMSTYISLLIGLYRVEKYSLFKAHVIKGAPKPNYEHIQSWHLNNCMAQMDDDLFDPEKSINEQF